MHQDIAVQTTPSWTWLALLVVLCPVLLVAMDGSVLFVAMPTIMSSIRPTADQALWILDIYGFVVASLLIAFGNIGDRYGRLRLICTGVAVFGAGSLGAAWSTSAESLIACRVLMGLGGATLLPSSLAIISTIFPDATQRARAIGLFAATFALGIAIGPFVGGLLLRSFSWGAVFLINIPVVILFLVSAPLLIREARERHVSAIDASSVLLSSVGILTLIYSIKVVAADGIGIIQSITGLAGIAALAGFIWRQKRLAHPLVDIGLFQNPVFAMAILTGVSSVLIWSAISYLSSTYLQAVLGYDALSAALHTLPGTAVLVIACVQSSRIVARIGQEAALAATHCLIGAGVALLMWLGTESGSLVFIQSTIVSALGFGVSFSTVAEIAVSAAPADRAGAASSIAETSNELGNALGIALFGSAAVLWFRLNGPHIAPTLSETLETTGATSIQVMQAKAAYLGGLHVAVILSLLLSLAIGGVAFRGWLRARRPLAPNG